MSVSIECKQCHRTFSVPPYRASKAKFCSRECKHAFMTIVKSCEVCGGTIRGYRSRYARQRFCSHACRSVWQARNPSLFAKRVATTRVSKVCPTCGETFESWRANERIYCSTACWHQVRKYHVMGSRHPLWKGSKRTSITIRNLATRHFPNRCTLCGWSEASCDAHHIVPTKDGGENTLANMIMLCPNHHRIAWEGKIATKTLQESWHDNYDSLNLDPSLFT